MTSQRRWYHDETLSTWIICYAIWIVLNWGISARLEQESGVPTIQAVPMIEQSEPEPMSNSSVFLLSTIVHELSRPDGRRL